MVSAVQLPQTGGGRRSSSALGREVVAQALSLDPAAAARAGGESSWRTGYLPHFRALVEAGLASPADARRVAADGLAALHGRLVLEGAAGAVPLAQLQPAAAPYRTQVVTGTAEPERQLTLPWRGDRLRGDALRGQLDAWVARGSIEPSCREKVLRVLDHPEWLAVAGRRVVVLGAGAEMGPLPALLRWGADVVGVDVPRPQVWSRVLAVAQAAAGTLTYPVRDGAPGADLLTELPEVTAWLCALPGRLVLGNYVYADGVTHLRVSAAVDALTAVLLAERPDTALALLATPTDVFAVPERAVADARARRRSAGLLARPTRVLSGGRLLQPQYADLVDLDGRPAGLHDSLVPQQGPNYALAKRLQRWRATVAAAAGTTVSLAIAPPTRTRSVLKNRLLSAAYAGCRHFGVEVFEPATSNVLMAALLVHDLHAEPPAGRHPYELETDGAAHGGLWRQPYEVRSVLGLSVLAGARHLARRVR